MHRVCAKRALGMMLLGVLSAAGTAHAGVGTKILRGLSFVDFQFTGSRDIIGDGHTINGFTNYNNREFDFGNADLTLSGPLGFTGTINRRGIPELEFSLNTLNQALSYEYNLNTGAQDLTATGSVLIDMGMTVNALGFYDQLLQVSHRGSFETDGYLLRDGDTLDFDIGPIDISGNVYLDALAVLTQPIFNLTETDNIFSKLSGRAQRESEFDLARDTLMARVDAGEMLTDAEIEELVSNSILSAILGGDSPESVFDALVDNGMLFTEGADPTASSSSSLAASVQPVPEPSTLLLLGAVSGLLVLRRRA